jgi:hypothetical protein
VAVTHTPLPGVVATMPGITDGDVSMHVVTADGDDVGLVAEAEDGTAYMDPDRDITGFSILFSSGLYRRDVE